MTEQTVVQSHFAGLLFLLNHKLICLCINDWDEMLVIWGICYVNTDVDFIS